MQNAIGVRFKKVGRIEYYRPSFSSIRRGDWVIAETERGLECGEVVLGPGEIASDAFQLRSIRRRATANDLLKLAENKKREKDAFEVCRKKIIEHTLPMKLINASIKMADGISIVTVTRIGPMALGIRWWISRCQVFAPASRLASTYSECLRYMTSLRTTRAVPIQLVKHRARITEPMLEPKISMIRTMYSRRGRLERMSTMRGELICDLFLLGANALTHDVRIVNIDGNGNRVAASIFGPKRVVYVVGRNKIVRGGIDDAIARIKQFSSPANCRRLERKTPCAITGECTDCASPDRICKVTVVFDRCPTKTPTGVLLIDEELGY